MTRYWLMKSEPDECAIDDALAAPASTVQIGRASCRERV